MRNFFCVAFAVIAMYISAFSLCFNVKSGVYTFYSELSSSSAFTVCEYPTALKTKMTGKYKAETVCVCSDEVSVECLLTDYKARFVKKETYPSGESRYYYSPKIPFYQIIDGFMVNIQVAVTGNKTYIGTPVIYGGY